MTLDAAFSHVSDLTVLGASDLSRLIHARRVSCRELMRACLDRIHALNPRFNALVNLAPDDDLLRQADACDSLLTRGESRGWLHGIPQAIKDAAHAVGFPTTYGLGLHRDTMPVTDGLMAARMKAAGAIVIGKTNLPEFGLGSHTFNELFGATRNAWDEAVSAGGSSGGAAVALALRLLPVADGSDFMGSLRNPAGWNHVFGMRPSQGRVPAWPRPDVFVSQLATEGPMARRVQDLARLLSTQAGHDPRVPLSIAAPPGTNFVPPTDASVRGLRIGWLRDLGGHLPFDDGVLEVCEQALARLESGGAIVEPAAHGFDADAVWQAWLLWRRLLVAPNVAAAIALAPDARDHIKPEALWEHDQAQGLSAVDFMRASQQRSAFHSRMLALFDRFDLLALPSAQVWPFAVAERWPREVGGRTMDTYHRWMEVTIYATFAGLPALCVPAGFHANGRWPMGLQLIGRPQADAAVLHAAQGYENLCGEWITKPPPAAG